MSVRIVAIFYFLFSPYAVASASGSPPTIDAGPAKTIAFPAKDLSLFGHAADPEKDPLTIQWTQVSGPAQATFSAPWALITTVSFSSTGNYVFRLSVGDGTTTVTSDVTITVKSASSQTAFFVDPTYTGAVHDGSAAHPWTNELAVDHRLNNAWTVINVALASNDVVIYFSARQAASDVAEVIHDEVDIWRSDTSSHRLTLDGMSKYNSNEASPSWADYTGANKFSINITNGGSISIGDQGGPGYDDYPANSTTIRGFDVSGATGRITWAGNYSVIEYIHSHDVSAEGATVMFHLAVHEDCTPQFGNMHDITVRNNLIERGEGEGIYIGGNYPLQYGGCPSWGNTHSDLLVEGNTITDPGQNGGEGDGVDLKMGLMNVAVRNNTVSHTHNGNASCIASLGVFNSNTVRTNYLFENNVCNDTQGIRMVNVNGVIVRNNLIYGGGGIGISGLGTSIVNYDVRIYNNSLIGAGIGAGDTDGMHVRNNIITGLTAADTQLGTYDSRNIDSDYNILESGVYVDSKWLSGGVYGDPPNGNEAHSQTLLPTASLFVNPANGDFHLASGSPAIDQGVNLSVTGFTKDLAGNSRPQGSAWDDGAYEFLSGQSFSACDLNSDGLTNVTDVQRVVNQAIGITACTADINQDSQCNVVDVQRVVNAALGGACVTP